MYVTASGSIDDWRVQFAALDSMPQDASGLEKRRRGHQFERVLDAMFASASMEPRTRFRHQGEEIDGSFLYQGRPILLEAKWTAEPLPASSLYQFKGKLDGKLVGTLGVFISMGGYSDDAVDALVAGKSINLILFDGDDMREIARPGGIGIAKVIAKKLRAAAETGTPFLSMATQVQSGVVGAEKFALVVEGAYDLQLINALSRRASRPREFTVLPAGGLFNLAPAGLALLHLSPDIDRLVIVIDGDGRGDRSRHEVSSRLETGEIPEGFEVETIVLDPNFEQALGLVDPARRRPTPIELSARVAEIDLGVVAASSADLQRLFQILGLLE